MKRLSWLVALALTPIWAAAEPMGRTEADSSLTTEAERSGFVRTGRYAEVEALSRAFAARWPEAVKVEVFGRTPEGRPMLALVVTRSGATSPEQARARNLPVVLMQGGIHAGEIDGKDAGFLALRELLEKGDRLDRTVWVFVPVLNIDGHERVGKWNRPNQVGPEEMGWRVTSQNLNLNRDYAKADSPEMLAMLGLLNRWDPILYVDLHVTDGSEFQPDIANLVEPIFVGAPELQPLGKALQTDLNDRLRTQGSLPLAFYPSLRDHRDPASGFSDHAYLPRFSTGYWALANRLAILVETHSWKDYPTRVRATHNTILALLELAQRDGARWLAGAARADENARSLGGTRQPLSFKTTERHHMIDFPGYAYTREKSEISGGIALRYDPKRPQNWRIPLYDEVVADVQVTAPRAGYLAPPGSRPWLEPRLQAHGLRYQVLEQGLSERPVEVFRASAVQFASRPSEGHMTARLSGSWTSEPQPAAPGSLFIPISQPKSRLVLALLEPQAPDSFAAWGFFNAHFEQKEYMEEYVAEEVARDMLARNPEVAAEFRRRLEADPEFARSPEARLDFFYRKHPSWDTRFHLYPVYRLNESP